MNTSNQKIIELPIERPAIQPDEDPAGHVSCLVGLLAEPAGGKDRHRVNAHFRQPY